MNYQLHKLEHQMSYSSSSTRASKVTSATPFCKVCYDAGLPMDNFTSHYVKDQPGPNGKVVCPTLLAQKCLTCGVPGHTSNYCTEKLRGERERSERDHEEREQSKKLFASGEAWETVGKKGTLSSIKSRPRIEDMAPRTKTEKENNEYSTTAPRKTYRGFFGVLSLDEQSSEDECEKDEIQSTHICVPKPVLAQRHILTGPPPAIEPTKPLTWAQRAAAAAEKPFTTLSRPAAPLADTRFQLHALCERIEMDKRFNATAPKRAAAAAVATESSRKRKQESAMVPA